MFLKIIPKFVPFLLPFLLRKIIAGLPPIEITEQNLEVITVSVFSSQLKESKRSKDTLGVAMITYKRYNIPQFISLEEESKNPGKSTLKLIMLTEKYNLNLITDFYCDFMQNQPSFGAVEIDSKTRLNFKKKFKNFGYKAQKAEINVFASYNEDDFKTEELNFYLNLYGLHSKKIYFPPKETYEWQQALINFGEEFLEEVKKKEFDKWARSRNLYEYPPLTVSFQTKADVKFIKNLFETVEELGMFEKWKIKMGNWIYVIFGGIGIIGLIVLALVWKKHKKKKKEKLRGTYGNRM